MKRATLWQHKSVSNDLGYGIRPDALAEKEERNLNCVMGSTRVSETERHSGTNL